MFHKQMQNPAPKDRLASVLFFPAEFSPETGGGGIGFLSGMHVAGPWSLVDPIFTSYNVLARKGHSIAWNEGVGFIDDCGY